MERQISVRVPADMAELLEHTARHLQRRRSEVVRLALEQFLAPQTEERPIERVRDLLGCIESGVPDLGQRHREHLVERLRRAR